jgi:DNA mismatch endonuclease (patch repair protein)
MAGCPDIVLPRHRKVIFVSGCFWHYHRCGRRELPKTRRAYWLAKFKRNKKRDERNQRLLRESGWGVLVIWECEIEDAKALAKTVFSFLGRRN